MDTAEAAPDIAKIGRALKLAFGELVEAMTRESSRPVDLSASTGIGKDVAYRVVRATKADDPLAVTHLMPGPAPLKRLIRGAERRGGLAEDVAARAREAVSQYEGVIATHAGDRSSLDVLISGWMPEVREKLDVLARQSMFRGASQLYGLDCECYAEASILVPSQVQEGKADGVVIRHLRRLRRNREGAPVVLPVSLIGKRKDALVGLDIQGREVRSASDLILEEFTSEQHREAELQWRTGQSFYLVSRTPVGLQGVADITMGGRTAGALSLKRAEGRGPFAGGSVAVTVPARELVCDVLVHESVYAGQRPTVYQFDTARFGITSLNDPHMESAWLAEPEEMTRLGRGVDRLRLASAEGYVRCLRHVLDKIGGNAGEFRAFRFRLMYPVLGSQVSFAFRKE